MSLHIVAVILRFIIPVFIALSYLFSQLFLESGIAKNSEQLSAPRAQVSDIAGSPTRDSGELEDEKSELEKEIDELGNLEVSAREEMEQLDARIEKLDEGVGPWRLLPTRLDGASDSEELGTAKKQRQETEHEVERLEAAIKDSKDALECINTRIAGESCDSVLDRKSNAGTAGISQLKEMFERLDHMGDQCHDASRRDCDQKHSLSHCVSDAGREVQLANRPICVSAVLRI